MKRSLLILAVLAAVINVASAQIAQVTWGAYQTNGIGTASGQPLPVGNTVWVGSFDIANNTISSNATDYTFLLSHFTLFAQSTIGSGDPSGGGDNSGYWLSSNNNSTLTLGIAGLPIYYWLFNSPNPASATEYGIFTASTSTDSNTADAWIFPSDTAIPNTTITDLSQVPIDSSGILFGSFGTGVSADGMSPLYNLAVVPEPSTYALLLVGLGGISYVGRRRKQARQ